MIADGAEATKAEATEDGAAGPLSVPAECARMKLVKEPSAEAESETPGAEKPLPLDPGSCGAVAEGGVACAGAAARSTKFVKKNWVYSPAG
jgi:hypothetical protein